MIACTFHLVHLVSYRYDVPPLAEASGSVGDPHPHPHPPLLAVAISRLVYKQGKVQKIVRSKPDTVQVGESNQSRVELNTRKGG